MNYQYQQQLQLQQQHQLQQQQRNLQHQFQSPASLQQQLQQQQHQSTLQLLREQQLQQQCQQDKNLQQQWIQNNLLNNLGQLNGNQLLNNIIKGNGEAPKPPSWFPGNNTGNGRGAPVGSPGGGAPAPNPPGVGGNLKMDSITQFASGNYLNQVPSLVPSSSSNLGPRVGAVGGPLGATPTSFPTSNFASTKISSTSGSSPYAFGRFSPQQQFQQQQSSQSAASQQQLQQNQFSLAHLQQQQHQQQQQQQRQEEQQKQALLKILQQSQVKSPSSSISSHIPLHLDSSQQQQQQPHPQLQQQIQRQLQQKFNQQHQQQHPIQNLSSSFSSQTHQAPLPSLTLSQPTTAPAPIIGGPGLPQIIRATASAVQAPSSSFRYNINTNGGNNNHPQSNFVSPRLQPSSMAQQLPQTAPSAKAISSSVTPASSSIGEVNDISRRNLGSEAGLQKTKNDGSSASQNETPMACRFDVKVDLSDIHETAKERWLTICEIEALLNLSSTVLPIQTQRPTSPPSSGTLILYNRSATRDYKNDGHSWTKKRNSKKIREDHVKLRVEGVKRIAGCYVHHETIPSFHRRGYHLLNPETGMAVVTPKIPGVKCSNRNIQDENKAEELPSLILIHYLDTVQAQAQAAKRASMLYNANTEARAKSQMMGTLVTQHSSAPGLAPAAQNDTALVVADQSDSNKRRKLEGPSNDEAKSKMMYSSSDGIQDFINMIHPQPNNITSKGNNNNSQLLTAQDLAQQIGDTRHQQQELQKLHQFMMNQHCDEGSSNVETNNTGRAPLDQLNGQHQQSSRQHHNQYSFHDHNRKSHTQSFPENVTHSQQPQHASMSHNTTPNNSILNDSKSTPMQSSFSAPQEQSNMGFPSDEQTSQPKKSLKEPEDDTLGILWQMVVEDKDTDYESAFDINRIADPLGDTANSSKDNDDGIADDDTVSLFPQFGNNGEEELWTEEEMAAIAAQNFSEFQEEFAGWDGTAGLDGFGVDVDSMKMDAKPSEPEEGGTDGPANRCKKNKISKKRSTMAAELAAAVDARVEPEIKSQVTSGQSELNYLERQLEELQRQQQDLYRQHHFQLRQQRMLKREGNTSEGQQKIKESKDEAQMLMLMQEASSQAELGKSHENRSKEENDHQEAWDHGSCTPPVANRSESVVSHLSTSSKNISDDDPSMLTNTTEKAPAIADFTPDAVSLSGLTSLPRIVISCSDPIFQQPIEINSQYTWHNMVAFLEISQGKINSVNLSSAHALNPFTHRCTVPIITQVPSHRYILLLSVRFPSVSLSDRCGPDVAASIANVLNELRASPGHRGFDPKNVLPLTNCKNNDLQMRVMTQLSDRNFSFQ